MTDVFTNVYANFGLWGLLAIGFAVLVVYVIRSSKEREERLISENKYREDKLYTLVEALSQDIPTIRKQCEAIPEMNNTIQRIKYEMEARCESRQEKRT